MSQLLDGHPECYVHPAELQINRLRKFTWPTLDLSLRPKDWFEVVFEPIMSQLFVDGFRKGRHSTDRLKFLFVTKIQRDIFSHVLADAVRPTARDVLDAYMTSFFNAWLDYQGGHDHKRWIVGFWPMLALVQENVDEFFQVYPDGRLLSVIRDPVGWYASASEHTTASGWFDNPQEAVDLWIHANQMILRNRQEYPRNIRIIRFDSLVKRSRETMQFVAEFLDLSFDPTLLTPTFNGKPIMSNTSFATSSVGILDEVEFRDQYLDPEIVDFIRSKTDGIYAELRGRADI